MFSYANFSQTRFSDFENAEDGFVLCSHSEKRKENCRLLTELYSRQTSMVITFSTVSVNCCPRVTDGISKSYLRPKKISLAKIS